MSFTSLGLHDQLVEGVAAAGFTEPTTVQALAIPPALEGRDILCQAIGGSGKTEAYVMPLLQRLSGGHVEGAPWAPPRALILSPTRKSVQEIQAAALRYGKHLALRVVGVFGGIDIDKQIRLLRRRTEVIVATPGRLLDHLSRSSVDLSHVEYLVIDDGEKLAELGLFPDVRKIVDALPPNRQTLLFAGTLNPEIRAFAEGILRDPILAETGERASADNTRRERFVATNRESRMRMLLHLLESESMDRVLVVSRKEYEAERISRILQGKGIPTQTIYNNGSTTDREHALTAMREGSLKVLVATEEAMQTTATDGVSHLINFDFPRAHAHDRTRWESQSGQAHGPMNIITFVTDGDRSSLHRMERVTGKRIMETPFSGENDKRKGRKKQEKTTSEGRRTMVEQDGKQFEKGVKPPKRRKKAPIVFARRKKPLKKLETFSSDHSGAGW